MKNYLDFEKEITELEQEVDGLKSPFGSEGISEVDTKKIKDESNIINRSKTIRDILDKETKIIVTYPEAIFEKIPNEKEIDSKTINIEKGQFLKINSIRFKL